MITVLRTLGPVLAKTWLSDGTIAAYDDAKQFTVRRMSAGSLLDLGALLKEIQNDPRSCIIRGAPSKNLPDGPVHRTLDNFVDEPSHLFMVDVDKFDGDVSDYLRTLPECFQDTDCVVQYSGSYGHPSKPGLRAHLWFWLAEPLTCAQAEAWAKRWLPQADHTVHRLVQVNYTAAPLTRGTVDPCPMLASGRLFTQSGLLGGPLVLPPEMPVPTVEEAATHRASTRKKRQQLVDPRDKPGIVGAVARAFEPARIVDLFPDLFAAGSKPERLTWLAGGGSADGVRVTDSGTHLFNSHATAPLQHAAPLFDFVRAHVYGHLDAHLDEDAGDLDVTALPSYRATVAWARAHPEVQAQLEPPPDAPPPRPAKKETDAAPAAANAEPAPASDASDASAEPDPAADPDGGDGPDHQSNAELRLKYQALITACPDIDHLKGVLAPRIGRIKKFDATDRLVLAAAMQDRAKAFLGMTVPKPQVLKWLEPPRDTGPTPPSFPDLGIDGQVLGTLDNLEALCAQQGITIRYNEITKQQEILGDDFTYDRENRDNATFATLVSKAAQVQMPHNSNQLKGYVTALAARNTYNPVRDWVTSQEWDRTSRIDALLATMSLAPAMDVDLARTMLRKWLIQTVAVACSPLPLQARGMLCLAGPQYKGKSRWIGRLCQGHDELVVTGRLLDPHNKDTMISCIRHWIAEIGELDNTLSKAHAGAIKAFLSDSQDKLRLPYAAAESHFQRRTSFAASVNADAFLVDETGNTRFWVIKVLSLDAEHDVDMQQVWAEAHAYWAAGEPHWLSQDEMAKVEVANEAHKKLTPIQAVLKDRFPWDAAAAGDPGVTWVTRTSTQIAALTGLPTKDVVHIGNALTAISPADRKEPKPVRRGSVSRRERWVPMEAKELELDEIEDVGDHTVP